MIQWIDRHYNRLVGIVMFMMIVNFLCLHTGWNLLLGALYLSLAIVHYRSRLWKKQADSAV
ncbi:hypothetical protein [Paenibacillus wenxiniae]|uniref:Uncharacterized protein n=1 Tax=Paenibacillus wenxiniae TaxID=1636843 RepID=A0ABW4RJZ1_9BACL